MKKRKVWYTNIPSGNFWIATVQETPGSSTWWTGVGNTKIHAYQAAYRRAIRNCNETKGHETNNQ